MSQNLFTYRIQTSGKQSLTNIDVYLEDALAKSGVKDGILVVFCPHTTAAITINENADPDVQKDLNWGYTDTFPNKGSYRHVEGNSDAHIKSSLTGAGETIILTEGKMLLGTWQSIYFWDYDGPRNRKFHVKIIAG